MKKGIKLTLVAVLLLSASPLFAQKFGRVNMQEIIVSMPETAEMQKNLEAYHKELQSNLETMTVEFNTKLQEFQKNYNSYTDAIRQMKEKELNELQTRSREFSEVAEQDLAKRRDELLAPIYEKAKGAIDKVGKAGGYLAVFEIANGPLAYFDEASLTDLGPEVKTELGIKDTPAVTTPAK